MKTLFVFALLVIACYAAPKGAISKGEMPLVIDTIVKGNEAVPAVQEEKSELWIPMWFSNLFGDDSPNDIQKPDPKPRQRPQQQDFDTSEEYLMAENRFHFGSSEEEELPVVTGDEHRFMPYKHPEHVRDAVLYNKVMPVKEHFEDYSDFLEETHKHLLDINEPETKEVKNTWNSWFNNWF